MATCIKLERMRPPRMPETPTPFESAELRLLHGKLLAWAAKIEQAARYVSESQHPLYIFKSSGLQDGLRRASPFFDEVDASLIAAGSGNPVGPDTRKTRPKAGKSTKSVTKKAAESKYKKGQ